MSHQTGIKGKFYFRGCRFNCPVHIFMKSNLFLFAANQELKAFFGKCREGDTRIFKVAIVNGTSQEACLCGASSSSFSSISTCRSVSIKTVITLLLQRS